MTAPNIELPEEILDGFRQLDRNVRLLKDRIRQSLHELHTDTYLDQEVLNSAERQFDIELKKCTQQTQSSIDNIQCETTDLREKSKQDLAWRNYVASGPNTDQAGLRRPVQNMDLEKKKYRQGFDQNEKCLDEIKRDFDVFFKSANNNLNDTRKNILDKILKQKDKNRKMLQYWINNLSAAAAEQNEENPVDKALEKLYQDTTIMKYDLPIDPSFLGSLGNACRFDAYKTIKVCSLNVCGLAKRLRENKPKFEEFINEHEILCFTEIKAHEADATVVASEHSILVNGYNPYLKCRPESEDRRRGIGIYVHEKLQPFINEIEGDCEYVLWIEIKYIFPTIVLLGVVYIPSKSTSEEFDLFAEEVKQKCSRYGNVILTGDFNSHTRTAEDFLQNEDTLTIFKRLSIPLERSNQDKTPLRSGGNKLIELCILNNIRILNGRLFSDKGIGEPTFIRHVSGRIEKTVIDYVIAKDGCLELFKSFKVRNVIAEGNTFSDHHSALVFELDCSPLAYT